MRGHSSAAALAVVVTLIGSNLAWAGSAGRRNTALAATALAVGAWSHGTGKAGRKNTAILATAGAAVAWSRYQSKKKQENRRARYARVASRPVYRWQEARCAEPKWEPPGRHLGWYKNHGPHGHHGHHGDD